MDAQHQSKPSKERVDSARSTGPDLPFRVELWDDDNQATERVVARAHSATLAQAVFKAACEQYPGRHLSLWRGRERVADNG